MADRDRSYSQSNPSLITMQELDPSPVDETPPMAQDNNSAHSTPDLEKGNGSYFPPTNTSTSTSSSHLGLSGSSSHHHHSLPWWASRIQQYSTYPFAAYLALHVTNTSLIPLLTQSVPASENYLLLTRPYYQSPLMEPLLIGLPLALHVGSGIALRVHRRRQTVKRYGAETFAERRRLKWPALSAQAALGYVLGPLLAGHVLVNRVVPLQVEGGSSGVGLGFVAHGFAKHPVVANAGYAVLVGVGVWHVLGGVARWGGWGPETVTESGDYGRQKRRRRWWVVQGVSALATAVWLAGGLGVVGRGGKGMGWEAKGWDELYRRVPVVGEWMG